MRSAVLALASTLVALSLPASAWAADVFHRRTTGPLALALVEHIDGCITMTVELFVVDQVIHESPSSKQLDQVLGITIEQQDTCGQEPVTVLSTRGQSNLANAEFQVAKKLESASLVATIEVVDSVSGNAFDVFIDVDWTANAPLQTVHEKFVEKSPGTITHGLDRGTFRHADLTGSISGGTTDFLQSATVLLAVLNDVTFSLLEVSKNKQ